MRESPDRPAPRRRKPLVAKVILWILAVAVAFVALVYVSFRISPWPSALLIRRAFEKDAARTSRALEKHLPQGVSAHLNHHYDPSDGDAYLDVFYPSAIENTSRSLTTIVWVHGGAWISGSKDQIANYAKILAGNGYTVVGVDYSIAPGKTYPTPVRQVNAALAYLVENAAALHIDPQHLTLAGDSGGAQIAAQLANIVSEPSYAGAVRITPAIRRPALSGVVLFCGPYDVGRINLAGPFGSFLKTVLWSYSGEKDFAKDTYFATASVVNYVTPAFPPAFISVGNADPLEPQSHAFAEALTARGVSVDALFFPHDYAPPLPHEYQFDLDSDAGRVALDRELMFLSKKAAAVASTAP